MKLDINELRADIKKELKNKNITVCTVEDLTLIEDPVIAAIVTIESHINTQKELTYPEVKTLIKTTVKNFADKEVRGLIKDTKLYARQPALEIFSLINNKKTLTEYYRKINELNELEQNQGYIYIYTNEYEQYTKRVQNTAKELEKENNKTASYFYYPMLSLHYEFDYMFDDAYRLLEHKQIEKFYNYNQEELKELMLTEYYIVEQLERLKIRERINYGVESMSLLPLLCEKYGPL